MPASTTTLTTAILPPRALRLTLGVWLVDRLIRMSRLPVLRATLTDVLSIVDDLHP